MRQIAYDRSGRKWTRFSETYPSPPYAISPTAIYDISTSTVEHLSQDLNATEIQCSAIPLPFYTLPMWPSKREYVENCCDFCYYVCLSCGDFVKNACRICLMLILSQTAEGELHFSCRIQIMCIKCSPNGLEQCSFYPAVISVGTSIHPNLVKGWKNFLKRQISRRCSVCDRRINDSKQEHEPITVDDVVVCCKDCAYALSLMADWQHQTPRQFVHRHPREIMDQLIKHFFKIRLDVISPLLKAVCYSKNCQNIIQQDANPIICEEDCRRVIYCSRRCRYKDRKRHFCKAFEMVWKSDNVLPMLTWTLSNAEPIEKALL